MAVKIWGPLLRNRQVVVYTDNESIVSFWGSWSSCDGAIMSLVCSLFCGLYRQQSLVSLAMELLCLLFVLSFSLALSSTSVSS